MEKILPKRSARNGTHAILVIFLSLSLASMFTGKQAT